MTNKEPFSNSERSDVDTGFTITSVKKKNCIACILNALCTISASKNAPIFHAKLGSNRKLRLSSSLYRTSEDTAIFESYENGTRTPIEI